jgi:L-threonylcarbamoyladenylate synthase
MADAYKVRTLAVSESTLSMAAGILRRGGLVALATDTVYGIAAASNSRTAISRIYGLKGRSAEKALPILIADQEQLANLARVISPQARALMRAFWPGALTLVLERTDLLLPELAPGMTTIGVRLPDRHDLRVLIRLVGAPVACSSANLSGAMAATSAPAVLSHFPIGLDLVLDGGALPDSLPSTVVDVSRAGNATVLRDGAISRARIDAVLGQAR